MPPAVAEVDRHPGAILCPVGRVDEEVDIAVAVEVLDQMTGVRIRSGQHHGRAAGQHDGHVVGVGDPLDEIEPAVAIEVGGTRPWEKRGPSGRPEGSVERPNV